MTSSPQGRHRSTPDSFASLHLQLPPTSCPNMQGQATISAITCSCICPSGHSSKNTADKLHLPGRATPYLSHGAYGMGYSVYHPEAVGVSELWKRVVMDDLWDEVLSGLDRLHVVYCSYLLLGHGENASSSQSRARGTPPASKSCTLS